MEILLIALSVIALIIGFLFLNDATIGVGIIGIAGVVAIFARIVQANIHHTRTRKNMQYLFEAIKEVKDEISSRNT